MRKELAGLLLKRERPRTQLLRVPLKSIRETYVMKRHVPPRKRAWIKRDILKRGLKDALEVSPAKSRGVWDLIGGSLRKALLAELFKEHQSIIFRPTGERISQGKVPVIATLTPLTPYEAHLFALRDNIDRRTVTQIQVGGFVKQLLDDEKLPWRSKERGDRIKQIAEDMEVTSEYMYGCLGYVTKVPLEVVQDSAKGRISFHTHKSIKGLEGRPAEQKFLFGLAKDGVKDKDIARIGRIMQEIPPGQLDRPRMQEIAKNVEAAKESGVRFVEITGLPFVKDAETAVTKVLSMKCKNGHNFTHIVCPECLEQQIAARTTCNQCAALDSQVDLSDMTPNIRITITAKELETRLLSYVQNEYDAD